MTNRNLPVLASDHDRWMSWEVPFIFADTIADAIVELVSHDPLNEYIEDSFQLIVDSMVKHVCTADWHSGGIITSEPSFTYQGTAEIVVPSKLDSIRKITY